MSLDRKQLKAQARDAMRETKPSIYLTTLVFFLILAVLEFLIFRLQYPGMAIRELPELYLNGGSMEDVFFSQPRQSVFSAVLQLAMDVMEIVISVGFTGACLCVSRRISAGVGELFEPFGFLLKAVWLHVVMAFFIWLWSLLLIIPGVVAAYRYSMAVYILLDDPDKSAMQCIRESKAMTKGHKGELFVLDLSFLGWGLLCMIPFVVLYVLPYMDTVKANYYNVLSGYQPEPEPVSEPPQDDDWWAQ